MKRMIAELKADALACAHNGRWYGQRGFWIVAIYRWGMMAKRLPPGLRLLAWVIYRVLHLPHFLFNVELWAGAGGCQIGPGLCLIHPNNLYFPKGMKIGANCLIHHEVTFGMGPNPGTPVLGDRVIIYPGARILGPVRLGDDVIVGANCVVTRNVPANTVVMAAGNRTLPRSLSAMSKKDQRERPTLRPPAE